MQNTNMTAFFLSKITEAYPNTSYTGVTPYANGTWIKHFCAVQVPVPIVVPDACVKFVAKTWEDTVSHLLSS